MKGIVSPDQKQCKCEGKGKFLKVTHRESYYFACSLCNKSPSLFRVRRYLPSLSGDNGKTVEIRYFNKKRLTTLVAAHAANEAIDELIESGNFDPADFLVKEADNMLIFSNFVANKYLPHYEKRVKEGLTSPATLAAKKQYLRNHLIPFFKDKNLKRFSSGLVTEFYNKSDASMRMRDLAAQELKALLNFARSIDIAVPLITFQKIKKSKLKDADSFLTYEQQLAVIDRIDDDRYKTMIKIMCFIAIRPSEVRALKWSDYNAKKGQLWIKRHVEFRSQIAEGRKSNDDVHMILVTDELRAIFNSMARSINQDEFMFKGDKGEIVSEHCLSRAWRRAITLTGLPYVDLYRGTKSSRLSQMLRAGHSRGEIAELAGIGEEALKRYAQHDNESRMTTQAKLLRLHGG